MTGNRKRTERARANHRDPAFRIDDEKLDHELDYAILNARKNAQILRIPCRDEAKIDVKKGARKVQVRFCDGKGGCLLPIQKTATKQPLVQVLVDSDCRPKIESKQHEVVKGQQQNFVDSLLGDWTEAFKSTFLRPPEGLFKMDTMDKANICSKDAVLY